MELSDCTWQHQKYATPETYLATLVEPQLNFIYQVVIITLDIS